jgi:hypothetical protein
MEGHAIRSASPAGRGGVSPRRPGVGERAIRQRPERAPDEKAENKPQQAHWPVSVTESLFIVAHANARQLSR